MNDSSKRIVLLLILSVCILLSFYRGYHATSMWSTNYYQLSYFDGFIKRSFVGTLLYAFGCIKFNYYFIEAIQYAVLIADISLLVYFSLKYRFELIAIIFFASSAGGYLFNEIGYPEQMIWIVAFLAALAMEKRRPIIAACLLVISVLIHETAFFITLPIMFAYMIIRKNTLASYIKVFAPAIAVFLLLFALFQATTQNVITTYPKTIASCGYTNTKLSDYLEIYQPIPNGEGLTMDYRINQLHILFVIIIISLLLGRLYQKELSLSWIKGLLLTLCCLAPLLLGFYAWDSDRWIFETFSQILIISMIVLSYARNINGKLNKSIIFYMFILLIAIVLNFKYFNGVLQRELTIENISTFASYFKQQLATIPAA